MGTLFVSHSSQDHEAVVLLREWLTERGFRSLFVDFDPTDGIPPGVEWEEELHAQLRLADGVLFVGTPASVASPWCQLELTVARFLGRTVVPLIWEAGGSHPLLAKIHAVDMTGRDELAPERLTSALRAADLDPERTFDWDPARSPYPGLRPFSERDAAVFFGRRQETEALLAPMLSTRRRYSGRMIAVVGPSGSGKSSLVRAGLIPRLRRAEPPWAVVSIARPDDRPLRQLVIGLHEAFVDAGATCSRVEVARKLAGGPAGLVALADDLSDLHPGMPKPPVLVFIDHAEELVSATAGDEHARLLSLLHGATRATGPLWCVVTLRSEFLNAFLPSAPGGLAFDEQLLIGPLDPARLAEVIDRPAAREGMRFTEGLVGRMVADTGGGDALPLLAYTLAELRGRARSRRERVITDTDYDDLGGVVGALRSSAENEHRRLDARGLGDLVVPTLRRLATVDRDAPATRRRLALAAFDEDERHVVDAFVDARLLTSTERNGEPIVEVAHEALLRQWPPLSAAIERHRGALQLRSELEWSAVYWEASGRHPDYLLPGERLAAALGLGNASTRTAGDLSEVARAFVSASEGRRRRREALERRRTQRIFGGMSGALAVFIALAALGFVQAERIGDQRESTRAALLAATALAGVEADPNEALPIAMRAYAKNASSLAEGVLRAAASQATPEVMLRGQPGPVYDAAFTRDGRYLASAGVDGTVRVWDWRLPRSKPTVLRGHIGRVYGVAFAPDGRHLVSAGLDGTVRVWDWRAPGGAPDVLRGHEGRINGVAFAGDGRHIATGGADGTVRVWDWGDRSRAPYILRGHRGPVYGVAFATDGRHVASAGGDATARVWDWRTSADALAVLRGHRDAVSGVAFASDGRIATAGVDGTVRVWAWRDPRRAALILRGHVGPVYRVAFDRRGRDLASAGGDGTVRVWDTRAPRATPTILRRNRGPFNGVQFAGDGRYLASTGVDGVVRVWDWRATNPTSTVLQGDGGRVRSVAFTVDGRHVATAAGDGVVRVWERGSAAPPTVLRGHRGPVNGVAFAPTGSHVASAGMDGLVRVWDWRAPRDLPVVLRGIRGPFFGVAFAVDGRHVAAAGSDGLVRVWDWLELGGTPIVLRGGRGAIHAVAFTNDGRYLVTGGSDGLVRVWNWRAPGAAPVVLRGHQGSVFGVAVTADGRHVASAGADGTVRVSDWHSPRPANVVLRGHQGAVRAVALAADGRHVASAGVDSFVRVWDWRAPAVAPTVFRDLEGPADAVAFAGDGRVLASSAADGSVRVRQCQRCGPIEDVLDRARARALPVPGSG